MIITDSTLNEITLDNPAPIASTDGSRVRGADQNRYHDLTLYRQDDGTLVCHIEYFSDWDGENDHDTILTAPDLNDLRGQLQKFELSYVRGFPPLPQYEKRQTNLIHWLRGNFCLGGKDLIIAARKALS